MSARLQKKAKLKVMPNQIVRALGEPDGIAKSSARPCYKQRTGSRYWGLTRISSREKPEYSLRDSYKFSSTGKCVNIYVMDSGINIHHKTFGGRARHGFTAPELYKLEGDADFNGHGTLVAGLAAGNYHITTLINLITVQSDVRLSKWQ